jgi:glycine dehydrogenase
MPRAPRSSAEDELRARTPFADRHIGPRDAQIPAMLEAIGARSIEELIDQTIPRALRTSRPLALDAPLGEHEVLEDLRGLSERNQVFRSYIGMGYHACITPPAIQRNILESPGWYTAYTPYQPEISQGRLEALLNFQTVVADLTGLPVANASLLDEATAAAEAMTLCHRVTEKGEAGGELFFVSEKCHPQTIEVVRARAAPLGIEVRVGDHEDFTFPAGCFGALLQYPDTDGRVHDYEGFCERAHRIGALVVVAADPLALTLLRAPGEFGADVAVGSTQRFGVPLGAGGPHAAYMATRDEHKRMLPGRIVGVSKDSEGRRALRLSLQTREQHIRRDKATSNICTAQVLLAVVASTYAVYHGPEGLRQIARRIHAQTVALGAALASLGHTVAGGPVFDALRVNPKGGRSAEVHSNARQRGINLRAFDDGSVGIALDETVDEGDLSDLFEVFGGQARKFDLAAFARGADVEYARALARTSSYLEHPVFHRHRSETELMRYLRRLANRDLALDTAMIPLGSCTMKLNAAAEMIPILLRGFSQVHPFAPAEQTEGYRVLYERLERWLAEITGFDAVSLQPNAGSQGEYSGLMVIRAHLAAHGEAHRKLCFIPQSAHGTNPASAKMAGLDVVVIACDDRGNIDLGDLEEKLAAHGNELAALMITYPSTHGVFETTVKEICAKIHAAGGQVYLDGANMNAMVGLVRPAELGADVCHLNLHKTFCIPHGGGGPGMGPIGVRKHLAPYLPGHPVIETGGEKAIGAISAAPYGSPMILPISYAYIAMMGGEGLTRATEIAILNANYVAARLDKLFPVLYRGEKGRVAHECILDTRDFKKAGVGVDDIAKRLMDYGFHAPTMSWPVAGTLMVEPTESEPKEELDRFCEAMQSIHGEIQEIERGKLPKEDNPLHNAPHTMASVLASEWQHPYTRERAAFPTEFAKEHKFWPAVARIDQAFGDRNLVCICPPVEAYVG